MKRSPTSRFWLLWTAPFILLLGSGLAVWKLIEIPFGRLFNTCLYLFLAGLILTLVLPGVRLVGAGKKWQKLCGSILLLLGAAVLAPALVVRFDYTLLPVVNVPRGLNTAQWQEDLDFLGRELPQRHPGFHRLITEEKFQSEMAGVRNRLQNLDETQIKAEFARLVALLNDAHTYPNIFSINLDWHMYPLDIYWFDDGIYVVNASREYRDLIGARLLKVCGTPVVEAVEAVRPYLSAENEFGVKSRSTGTILVAEWLYAGGVADQVDEAVFTLEKNGVELSVSMSPVHYLPVCYWMFGRTVDNTTCPVIANPRRNNYLFELDRATGTLVFAFNHTFDQEAGETLAGFTDRLDRFVEDHQFDRFVIDLRANDGGNSNLLPPLVDFIKDSPKINRPGKLFVITSRNTFSAAVMFAAMLDNNTEAILVGEPTSQGVKFYGGPRVIRLPNSGQEFMVSSHYTQVGLDCDRRDRIKPDIRTRFTWADYAEGRDPAMQAILKFKHSESAGNLPAQRDPERYTGRYLFSPYQILTIDARGSRLTARVSDFITGSYKSVSTDLYAAAPDTFLTAIDGMSLAFGSGAGQSGDGLMFNCHGTEKWVARAPAGFALPMELIAQGRIEQGVEAVLADKSVYASDMPGFEGVINSAGYRYLAEEKVDLAVRLFELNTRLFPESANTWDSLGEGCLKAGQTDKAVEYYQKSLELNPDNTNAKNVLKSLGIES